MIIKQITLERFFQFSMKKQNIFIYNYLISLLLGSLIYIIFRSTSLKMFSWYKVIGVNDFVLELRQYFKEYKYLIPNWVLFSLPDGLWIFSYVCLILWIWKGEVDFKNIFWIIIIPLVAIFSEVAQLLNIVSGTFDLSDLFFYLLGVLLPFIFFNKSITYNFKLNNYEKKF